LTGTAVAYAVAGSGPASKVEAFPDPPPPPPGLDHHDKGDAIILESGSPEARTEEAPGSEREEEREKDGALRPENFAENSRRAVTPNQEGDDAKSCAIASTAKARFERRQATRGEFESEVARAKREATGPAMREALDQALAGGELPACPPPAGP
jgi:hypothetical protein